MKKLTLLRLSCLMIFGIFLFQSCQNHDSFGPDLQAPVVPTSLAYADIIGHKQFGHMETTIPTYNSNGHPVTFEIVSIKKDGTILDNSYLDAATIVNYTVLEKTWTHIESGVKHTIYTNDLTEAGRIIIEDGNPFENGDYYFSIMATADVNGKTESVIFEDALHLQVGWADGIGYCPFKVNFVSGQNTISGPAEIYGGREDVSFALGSDSDKLVIDAVSGAISVNPEYTITETEIINPIIKLIYASNESVPLYFSGNFTAILSTAPVEIEKGKDYFIFPTLKVIDKKNVGFGGNGYSRQVVTYHTDGAWFNNQALWRNKAPQPNTPDAVAAREEAGVSGTQALEHSLWTLDKPSESWIIIDPANLTSFQGCYDSKVVFWYSIFLNNFACYEADGSTPIDLEVKVSNNYSGDVTTTDWTQVNDILECEINNNGTLFTGTPYPGDQSGAQPPNGVKDPSNSPNNLWVRAELNLDDYKTESAFTIAFRLKTYFDTTPNCPVNGIMKIANVHFVATEK